VNQTVNYNLIDSSAWLEYFAETINSKPFIKPIENIKNIILPTIIIFEVFKKISTERGENEARIYITSMSNAHVIELDKELSLSASMISIEYKLGMADSIIYATALKYNATLWTQDADFKGLKNVKYFEKK